MFSKIVPSNTTNFHPAEWYRCAGPQWTALCRRFTKVVYFNPDTPRDDRGRMVATVFERPLDCALESPEMQAFLSHPFWSGPGYWDEDEKKGWRYLVNRDRYTFC